MKVFACDHDLREENIALKRRIIFGPVYYFYMAKVQKKPIVGSEEPEEVPRLVPTMGGREELSSQSL